MRPSTKPSAAAVARRPKQPPAPEARRKSADNPKLTADALIIGLVGPLGSGCTFIAEGLRQLLGDRVHHFKLSSILHPIAKELNCTDPIPTAVLQDIGNDLRQKKGVSALAEEWHKETESAIAEGSLPWSPGHIILVDGIRNEGEVRYLRAFNNFFLLSVFAHRETRRKRLAGTGPGKKFTTDEEFHAADARDQNEDLSFGQQVTECNYRSDLIIDNDETFPERTKAAKVRSFCTTILNEYISLIERSTSPDEIVERPPTINETLSSIGVGP
jgi:dephospho-CoA kinase